MPRAAAEQMQRLNPPNTGNGRREQEPAAEAGKNLPKKIGLLNQHVRGRTSGAGRDLLRAERERDPESIGARLLGKKMKNERRTRPPPP